jgi:hypothetical protein
MKPIVFPVITALCLVYILPAPLLVIIVSMVLYDSPKATKVIAVVTSEIERYTQPQTEPKPSEIQFSLTKSIDRHIFKAVREYMSKNQSNECVSK